MKQAVVMVNAVKKNRFFLSALFVLLLLPFCGIYGVRNAMSSTIFQAWQVAAMGVLAVIVVIAATEIKCNWAVVSFAAYQAIVMVSTFVNHGFSPGIFTVMAAAVLLFMLLQSSCYESIVSALAFIVVVAALINFPVMLPQLSVADAQFFIAGKNGLGIFLVPGVFIVMINAYNRHGALNKWVYVMMAFCLVTVIIGASGTGIVVSVLALALILLSLKAPPKKSLYLTIILVAYAFLIFFLNSVVHTDIWRDFTSLLGKDSTLTSRTYVWNYAKALISEHWLFGAGRGSEITFLNDWGGESLFYEAHNFILEILLEGGMLALAVYTFLISKTFSGLDMRDKKSQTIFIALCVLLVNGLTESTVNNFFVTVILGIACHCAQENRGIKDWHEQPI